jgi:hypothetical protein
MQIQTPHGRSRYAMEFSHAIRFTNISLYCTLKLPRLYCDRTIPLT